MIVHEAGEGGLVAAGTYVQMRATPSQSEPIDQTLEIKFLSCVTLIHKEER